jgi:hypothetical protein
MSEEMSLSLAGEECALGTWQVGRGSTASAWATDESAVTHVSAATRADLGIAPPLSCGWLVVATAEALLVRDRDCAAALTTAAGTR